MKVAFCSAAMTDRTEKVSLPLELCFLILCPGLLLLSPRTVWHMYWVASPKRFCWIQRSHTSKLWSGIVSETAQLNFERSKRYHIEGMNLLSDIEENFASSTYSCACVCVCVTVHRTYAFPVMLTERLRGTTKQKER